MKRFPVFLSMLLPGVLAGTAAAQAIPTFATWAEKPVMGWNSWNCYGTSINEAKVRENADVMSAVLLPYGYNVFTIDIQWYQPTATGFGYDPNATHEMDAWGRLMPAPVRFPSAANGVGFKALGDYIHSKGLKFGIHIMRGIPRQAWQKNLPVKGTDATARDIAITTSTCSWNPDMYGVDVTKPAGQAYYDSLFELYASWGVDFIKVDDLSRPYDRVQLAEVEAIRKAIDKTGRKIVFSTSPGETPLSAGPHVMRFANQWRISDDFWDQWGALRDQFKRLHEWTPFRALGRFPDADMLAIGTIAAGSPNAPGRATYFNQNEQFTHLTLWAIARSPLILGADMTRMDAFTRSLLTNREVIAVNQDSNHNRQWFRRGDQVAWVADPVGSPDKYLALFHLGETATPIQVDLAGLGFSTAVRVRSLWESADLGEYTDTFAPTIQPHGAALYRLSGPGLPTPWLASATPASQQVTLAWEPVPNATSYRLFRAPAEDGPYAAVAENIRATSYTDTQLRNGTSYYYQVAAVIGSNATPASNSLRATPGGQPGTISWNYDRFGTVPADGIAGVEPVANWNNSWPANPVSNLVDSTGQPTSLDLSYTASGDWNIVGIHPGRDLDGSYNRELLNGYLHAGLAAWNPPATRSTVSLSEIPYPHYDLIVYISSDVAGREGTVSVGATSYQFSTIGPDSISSGNAAFMPTSQTAPDSWPAANYAVFRSLSGPSQTLQVAMRDPDEWGGIAGFQIVPRPDPLHTTQLRLEFQPASQTARLSWADELGAVVLEESSDLISWLPSIPQPTASAITLSANHPNRFYRLTRP